MTDPNFPTTTFNASANLTSSIAREGLSHRGTPPSCFTGWRCRF
jgi:hypothetical protein